jgi:hypothetical protein
MAKFDLKKAILENKATFFGSLNEGQFSWMTQDTGQQIGSEEENTIPVYMFDNTGKYYYEPNYDGYGVFGGKDYYELLDQMNGGKGDRDRGIDLAFDKEKTSSPVLFPALVTSPSNFNYKTHDFTKEAESDPNQSWYTAEEDDDDDNDYYSNEYGDEDEDELEEGKVEEAYNSYTFKVAKNFAKYMSKKEGRDFEVTMNSVDEYSFDLDLDGELYAGGSYLIQNGNIHNVAIPGNPIYATTDDMEDYIGEGYDEFKRADKGSKGVTAKNKGEEEVYGAGVKKGEEIEKKKMKMSEFKAKIKEMVLAEMNLDIDNMEDAPESEVDFLAEIEEMLNEVEGLTPLQDYIYQYEIEISGEDRAQEFLDDIRKLNTPDDVYNYYAYDRDWSGSMDDDLENIYRQVKRKFKNLEEAKKDEEVADEEIEVTDEFSTEEPQGPGGIDVAQNADADLTGDKKDVQDNLEAALEAAKALGDDKLATQIGNSLTFFTKQHVVKEDLKETLLLQKRAGIITETQYKQKLNEISEDEVPLTSKVKSFINKAIADSKKDGEFENLKKVDWFENELIDELIELFPNKDYDSASSEVMDYIKDKIK